ncbi:beta-glucosidase [Breznakibacter xylanolyticus]|uniref:Beta-glucosidase n=1 Tax=Breznakibacter xylanolyticus TaxID=990 RepID=A0A2W7N7M0_9BACT|nr:glycoside hydrolase family 3 C-terminal domain-containing protein [Breznakibacter xylanolyticus]PZX16395.1 beta-glucosidase [Breznakibacter xylanolyticus]
MKTNNLLLVAGCAAIMAACQVQPQTDAPGVVAISNQYDAKIDSIVGVLTLDEKVKLLHGSGMFWSGGIERLGIPELQYADGPLGIREEIERDSWNPIGWTNDSATFFPAGTALGATWNVKLAHQYGQAIAAEARARKKDILLAPAINIMRTPLCGRNYEYFSEDPYLIAQMATPYVIGVQEQNVAACVKHYAINNQETNRGSIDVQASERAIREIYLPAFKATVQQGQAFSVMGAYNRFRGEFLCENDYMLNQVLRNEWGFKGIVISDWAAVHNTVKAAKNGLDIEMGTVAPFDSFFMAQPLVDAVNAGQVDVKFIDEKVRRILRVMFNLQTTSKNRPAGAINTPGHSKIVYDVAAEAIVLMKNQVNLLPVDASTIKSMAVIGDNAARVHAQGGFGAGVKARYEVSPLQGLVNRISDRVELRYARGYEDTYLKGANDGHGYGRDIDYTPNPKLIAEAVEKAKNSDVAVIFAGSNRSVESESVDRKDIRLPFAQMDLIKAVMAVNPRTIVVLIGGAAYELGDLDAVAPTILWAWFNGSEAGNALADVIIGTVNPSGKLPFTFPAKLADMGVHALNAFPGDDVKVEYLEDILVGYRWFDTKQVDPQFCFGHGLSYTTFEYGDVVVNQSSAKSSDVVQVALTLTNTGSRAGAEVVQLYAGIETSKVERAAKELKAFEKVFLQPGESKRVELSLPVADLAYYDEASRAWLVEPGNYTFSVGSSSRDIRKNVALVVK